MPRSHVDEPWEVYDSHAAWPELAGREPRFIAVRTVIAPQDQVCIVAEVPPGLDHLVANALAVAERIVALHNAAD